MNYTLIILKNIKLAFVYHQDSLLSITMEHKIYPINKLYAGKISNILPSLDSAFIQLDQSENKNGFMNLDSKKKNQLENWKYNSHKNKHFLVQIIREPVNNKGPTVSSRIALKGKYLTLYPFQTNNPRQKSIYNNNFKEYFQALTYLLRPSKFSIAIKKETIKSDINFILVELNNLKNRWIKFVKRSKYYTLPSSLGNETNFISKIFKKYKNIKFDSIHVNSHKESLRVKKILTMIDQYKADPNYKTKIEFHKNENSLIKYFSLDLIISYATKPRVNLFTGGYIVIEKTEALTTIDINSGSFKSLPNSNQTSLWINYLAIHEIARQIKLRNIGGIIIIDFIDSRNQYDQMKLLKYINNLLKKDQTKCNIIQISELGLLELTRTRYGQSVYDAFTCKCKICNGLGYRSNYLNLTRLNHSFLLLDFHPIFLKKYKCSKNLK